MNISSYFFIFLFIIFVGTSKELYSQSKKFQAKNRYTSIGGSINAMNYVGETDPNPSFISPAMKYTKPNLGFFIQQRMYPRITGRAAISYGRIKGSDAGSASYNHKDINRRIRNLSFRNDILEIKADVMIDLFQNRGPFRKRPDYTPYFCIGVAYFHHNPKGQTKDGNWVPLKPLHTELKNYSLHQIALPIGFGFRYKISTQIDISFEIAARFTLTDYLDDISGVYADKEKIRAVSGQLGVDMSDRSLEGYSNPENPSKAVNLPRDPQLERYIEVHDRPVQDANGNWSASGYGRAGDQRGNHNKDWYFLTGFHLAYIFPGKVICPKFR